MSEQTSNARLPSATTLRRLFVRTLPILATVVLLLTSLLLIGDATQDSTRFGQFYWLIFVFNAAALAILFVVIGNRLAKLFVDLRKARPGARLRARLVAIFLALTLPPVIIVFGFSLKFLNETIDSWFDVRVEQAMEDALELGQMFLDSRTRDALRLTRRAAESMELMDDEQAVAQLPEVLETTDAVEVTLLAAGGRILGASQADPRILVPDYPSEFVLRQVGSGGRGVFAAAEPAKGGGVQVRVALPVAHPSPLAGYRILQAIYPLPVVTAEATENVEREYHDYRNLAYLRSSLKLSFTLILTLVLMLTVLVATLAGFGAARRVVRPIAQLDEATREVAAGNYDRSLSVPSRDELGFLVDSFNAMTERLSQARDRNDASQRELETQRAYLELILERLSSGVISVDADGMLRTANSAAGDILGLAIGVESGITLEDLCEKHPRLTPLVEAVNHWHRRGSREWRQEVVLGESDPLQVLMVRGASLPRADHGGGQVVVFDDLTELVQAQRDAAWAEVGRRLAHEVKNPLTPIQLAAERLRHKYLNKLEPSDAKVLDRATHTIVQQVQALKTMVNDFGALAQPHQLKLEHHSLPQLVSEVVELYRSPDANIRIKVENEMQDSELDADPGRLRQLLHNLIRNAQEAEGGADPRRLTITLAEDERRSSRWVRLTFEDNGPGFPEEIIDRLYEPYATTKRKGTGLGLAIVKQIVDDHGGNIRAENTNPGGALLEISLPGHLG